MSPLDRIVRAVDRRGIPWWAVFLGGFAILSLGIMAGVWGDGTVPFPELAPRALAGFYLPAAIAAYGLLTGAAGRALDRIRPVLDAGVDVERARRWLTTMPTWQFVGSGLVGAAVGGALITWVPAYTANIASPSVPNLIWGVVGFVVSYATAVIVSWQCVRLIAAVVHLHRQVPRVDLFRPGPAHAFAPVTAGVAVYLTLNMAFNAFSNPATLSDLATVLFIIGALITATAAFVLPLAAMRRRLMEAKRALLDDNAVRTSAAVAVLHSAVDAGEFDRVGGIQGALDALGTRREAIRRASTFPWEGRVASGFATTLLAPIAIWLITTAVGRLLGW